MTDNKEFAKQMRENAVKNEQGNIVCSLELWEEIASVIERAIIPPCKVGQTVYTKYGYSFKIEKFMILEDKKIVFYCGNDGTDDYMAFYDFEIGTDVFLTKEEAEEKLRERNTKND